MKKLSMRLMLFALFIAVVSCAQSPRKPEPVQTVTEAAPAQPMEANNDIDTNWTQKVVRTNEEWRKILTPEQYYITREQGTERPFSSPLYDNHDHGVFFCVCCNNPLFSSETKFNSGTGWPSFFMHYSSKSVDISKDDSHGMSRDELTCQRCGAHLGHIFDDGPRPTGLRYCIDGIALRFAPVSAPTQASLKKATFAGGCFWCEEATFEEIKGIEEVISGYSGGKTENPTYEEVGTGMTGHAESFEVSYNPTLITYADLVKIFVASIDPTQVNGQGPDHGSQYRSIIFYRNDEERKIATNYIDSLNQSGTYKRPLSVEIVRFSKFWPAENYHQNYVRNHPENPYVQHESIPRLKRTKSAIPAFFK
ncbi:MAG: bifunctional methionine sulfoxide reductase B/A protein [Saprospiraceae bacterium]